MSIPYRLFLLFLQCFLPPNMCSSGESMRLLCSLVLVLVPLSAGYSLDVEHSLEFSGPSSSWFGYSVLLHRHGRQTWSGSNLYNIYLFIIFYCWASDRLVKKRTGPSECHVPHRNWPTKSFQFPFFCDKNAAMLERDVVSVNISMATTLANQDWSFWKSRTLELECRLHKICQTFTTFHVRSHTFSEA